MRQAASHKGENGTVAVIGGSRHQHGAPIFSLLAAEASGVDLLYAFVPVMHEDVTKAACFNAQTYVFGSAASDELTSADRTRIVEFLATIDVAVIGPGLARTPSAIAGIMELLETVPCTVVADASALQPDTLKVLAHRHAVVTPHLGELERMGVSQADLPKIAQGIDCTFLMKAPKDVVVAEDGDVREVMGGNAGLTVGGTGDALAGLTAGLIAQGLPHADACVLASQTVKRAGEILFDELGFAFTTRDVLRKIPALLQGRMP